jgi:hypothetical protein
MNEHTPTDRRPRRRDRSRSERGRRVPSIETQASASIRVLDRGSAATAEAGHGEKDDGGERCQTANEGHTKDANPR